MTLLRALLFLLAATGLAAAAKPTDAPPAIAREFRAMWIATVGNIDWPSKPGLPVATQKSELVALLDTARRLNLNAVIFQVRTSCDALYPSAIEPWSEYLSGRMGVPPKPLWDPLEFAVSEAHSRGLELHAWFNPYRARYHQAISPVSADHVTRRQPGLAVEYGRFLWLDPGNPASRDHTLRVVKDVVQRYDVDGIHIDDYFYPYPEKAAPNSPSGAPLIPFPDQATWNQYQRGGGTLPLADWRRENVNILVRDLNAAIHHEKPWVKFGISPFGIWRPGYPAGIKGLDQHEQLYADVRKWLREGVADYLAPQLYWTEKQEGQRFSKLLAWWASENVSGRHLWPGLNASDIGKGRNTEDILWQVRRIGDDPKSDGVLLWNASTLRDNRGGLAQALIRGPFARPALIPACPWLGGTTPAAPALDLRLGNGKGPIQLDLLTAPNEIPATVVAQRLDEGGWKTELLPGSTRRINLPRNPRGKAPAEIRITLVGRTGLQGAPAVWVPGR